MVAIRPSITAPLLFLLCLMTTAYSFTATNSKISFGITKSLSTQQRKPVSFHILLASENPDDGVVELGEEEAVEDKAKVAETVAPFLSQGEIAPESMEMDFSDPKQTRVMGYMILSLIPVLFLIPLMLSSRELIPIDALPPVEM